MNLLALVASAILLQPVLAVETDLRLVASDTDRQTVVWYADGSQVAILEAGEAAVIRLEEGPHELWATTSYEGDWMAMARPAYAEGAGDVAYVDGWSGTHAGDQEGAFSAWPLLVMVAGAGTLFLGRRRPKRP